MGVVILDCKLAVARLLQLCNLKVRVQRAFLEMLKVMNSEIESEV